MFFRDTLSKFWSNVQYTLFPQLENDLGPLSDDHKRLISILELVRIEEFIPCTRFCNGRPRNDRSAIARAYIAKIIFKLTYTKQLINYLKVDKQLRSICGWDEYQKLPSESKFSRVFAEFASTSLPDKVHQSLIKNCFKNKLINHVVIDSTPIEAREKPLKKESLTERKKTKNKRLRDARAGKLNRRQIQLNEINNDINIKNLPTCCDKGMKKSAQGYTMIWKGYKLHTAVEDNCIPLAAIVTSASLNDCEVAIPLSSKSNSVAKNLYDLMDAAYDHTEIKEHSSKLGHIFIIDKCPSNKNQKLEKEKEEKRKEILKFKTAEDRRYKTRLPKERFNALYKDYNGGRNIFYRGHEKISCHIMLGVLSVTALMIVNLLK